MEFVGFAQITGNQKRYSKAITQYSIEYTFKYNVAFFKKFNYSKILY